MRIGGIVKSIEKFRKGILLSHSVMILLSDRRGLSDDERDKLRQLRIFFEEVQKGARYYLETEIRGLYAIDDARYVSNKLEDMSVISDMSEMIPWIDQLKGCLARVLEQESTEHVSSRERAQVLHPVVLLGSHMLKESIEDWSDWSEWFGRFA